MKKSLLDVALYTARKKLPLHPELGRFLHYSFVVQNNKIIEWATNAGKCEPPRHYGYHKADITYRPKYHAEIRAYRRAKGLLNGNPFQIINIRLNKQGVLRLSKPCRCCFDLMTVLGCTKFYYSYKNGFETVSVNSNFKHCSD